MAKNGNKTHANGNKQTGTDAVKRGLAQMLKSGVIIDVVTPEYAKIAENAGVYSLRIGGREEQHPPGARECSFCEA